MRACLTHFLYLLYLFLMTILWTIHLIVTVFCYHDLDSAPSSSLDHHHENTSNTVNEASSKSSETSFFRTISQDLLQEPCILMMFSGFVVLFTISAMDTALTPLSLRFFGWKEMKNSIYFSVLGLLFVASLASLSFTSKKFSNRSLLLCGTTLLTINMLIFLLFVIFAIQQPKGSNPPWMLALFIIFGAILGLAVSYALVPTISVFSNLTSAKNQGFNQGVFLIFRQLSRILGPLWASYLLNNLPLMIGVCFGMYSLVFIMYLYSYKRLPSAEDESKCPINVVSIEVTDSLKSNVGEKTPLFSSASN